MLHLINYNNYLKIKKKNSINWSFRSETKDYEMKTYHRDRCMLQNKNCSGKRKN